MSALITRLHTAKLCESAYIQDSGHILQGFKYRFIFGSQRNTETKYQPFRANLETDKMNALLPRIRQFDT
jgi:hypothetical protein